MTSKIHINLSAGIFEVEGEPEFVKGIYDDFKADLTKLPITINAKRNDNLLIPDLSVDSSVSEAPSVTSQKNDEPKKKNKPKSSSKKESYTIQDLQTGLPNQEGSIFSYLQRYDPKSNLDKNTVFVKYLKDKHPGLKITLDHIYTCYSNSGQKPSGDLYSSVIDTAKASKGYGYIDTTNLEDIRLVQKGELRLYNLEKATQKQPS